jgi:hypothetical protein
MSVRVEMSCAEEMLLLTCCLPPSAAGRSTDLQILFSCTGTHVIIVVTSLHRSLQPVSMLSQLKDRIADKLKDIGPQDDLDRSISALVQRGSNEELLGPNWAANMELCDLVNRHPE